MLKNVSVPEKVAERKIIVYKARIDPKVVRATAEKMKTKLFRKFVFIKPKPEEVHIVSIDKYFEPYVVVDGEYSIEYSKNWTRNIQVDETMHDVTIFGEKTRPVSLKDHLATPCKIVKLTGEGRYKFETKAHLIFDSQWHEVGLEQLPFIPFEEQPEKILSTLEQKFGNNMAAEKEVEILKSKLVRRPSKILSIHKELFNVSERAVIYKPMYKVTVKNFKTKKETAMIIDAITGKTTSDIQQTLAPRNKEPAKEPTKHSSYTKTTVDKVASLVKKVE